MVKLIVKSGYIKSGGSAAGYLQYIATRERVEIVNGNGQVTAPQLKLIAELLRDFPDSKQSYEYRDYQKAPTFASASQFITATLDVNAHIALERDGYMKYIATRPRVERHGEHGLFSSKMNVSLDTAQRELKSHSGNVWTMILSLRREDAARLQYDSAESWQRLILSQIDKIAKAMKVQPEQLHWYAAFHDESHHPHVHMMLWPDDPKQGYLTRAGIKNIRSILTNEIFKDELYALYERKDISYKELTRESRSTLASLTATLSRATVDSPMLEQLMAELSSMLKNTSGKKVYGYLKRPVKDKIDSIVDGLAAVPEVARCYEAWNTLRDQLESYYKDKPRERLPLSQQKEFRAIKNMVIREALRLELDTTTFEDDGLDDEMEDEESWDSENVDDIQPRTIYQQSVEYQDAKDVLSNDYASLDEKQLALQVLVKLWEQGYSVAAHQLGKVWRDGLLDGVKDTQKAEIWFLRSAETGNDYSQYALGKLLQEQGRVDDAIRWYEKAVDQGNQFAQYRLGKLFLTGDGVKKDVEQAVRLLTGSASRGNQYAQYALGKLYLMGRDVPKDNELALKWLTASERQGNAYAQFFLSRFDDFTRGRDPHIAASVIRLLHHMSRVFEDSNRMPPHPAGIQIDSKRRRQLMELKRARGLRMDDQEQKM